MKADVFNIPNYSLNLVCNTFGDAFTVPDVELDHSLHGVFTTTVRFYIIYLYIYIYYIHDVFINHRATCGFRRPLADSSNSSVIRLATSCNLNRKRQLSVKVSLWPPCKKL